MNYGKPIGEDAYLAVRILDVCDHNRSTASDPKPNKPGANTVDDPRKTLIVTLASLPYHPAWTVVPW